MRTTEGSTFQPSPLQRQLWSRSVAGYPTPTVQCRLALDGPVDVDRLTAAVDRVRQRHEALRTTLVDLSGTPAQQIHPVAAMPGATTVDLAGAEEAVRERCRREREIVEPFAGPSFRTLVLRRWDGGVDVVLTAHPAVADRTSLRVVVEEMADFYAGSDRASDPPVQYADFAAWHCDVLVSDEGAADRRAWSDHLGAGRPAAEPVPTAVRATPVAAAEVRTSCLGTDLASRLDAFAAAHGKDAGRVLAAVFAVVANRFHGDPDVIVEIAEPARRFPAIERAVGAFARTLPVRYRVAPGVSFIDVLDEFAGAADRWVERIDQLDPMWTVPHGPARFGFEYTVIPQPRDASGVRFRTVAESTMTETTDPEMAACLSGVRHDGDLEIRVASPVGGPAPAAWFAESTMTALRAVLDRPDTPVGRLRMVSGEHRRRLLAGGRGEPADVSAAPVHESIAAQAARTPSAIAVDLAGDEVCYRDLDTRANQLAHHLLGLGVGRGDRVVVSLARSANLVVAILGVLRAGAVFVPVDPVFPPRRLAHVVSDTGATVLIGDAPPADPAVRQVALDADWPHIATRPTSAPPVRVGPEDPAYILYTSGTTGLPNGVQVPHRGLANYLGWCVRAYDMGTGTGVLTHSSISFDFTLTTLLGPLLAGQRVILLPDGAGVPMLAAALRSARDLTLVKLTPTHLDVLGGLLTVDELAGTVRTVVVGGAALDARAVAPFRDAGVRVVNEYGPTETVVGSTAHTVDADTPRSGPVPIGRPIANTAIYLLDADGELVPYGATGEICIGGDGVALGYLNNPALTAERFVPEPDGPARVYRTGDLGRWRPDGTLEFLGRLDDQIKIHGVRVEPAEIEGVLLAHDGVAQAAIMVRRDEDPGRSSPLAGTPVLVAYVVPEPARPAIDRPAVDPAALARHCRAWLPDQLVPRAFVSLDALPLTVNGKLDRAALPRPDVLMRQRAGLAAPRTEVEEILAGAVANVLGLDAVDIDDNYFVLGGDSIRSVMVTSRAQARGVDVTVADLHAHPSVRDCAEHLRRRAARDQPAATAPFSLVSAEDRARMPADVEDAFPLNLLQEGMIFHRDFAAKSAVYHAIASIRLKAPYDHDVMRMAITQLVERHPMLRTSFDMTGFSRPLQLVHARFGCPLSVRDLRGSPPAAREEEVQRWIAVEKVRGFELDEYPLIRFMVQRLTDEEWQFTYGFHHEIVDGWSEALMIAELFSHYFATIYDEPVSLRAPTSTMRDAVALELEALRNKENYAFWERYLADATVMRLPRFGVGPQADKGAREIVRIEVPVSAELSDQLKHVALAGAMPMKNVLMAAHLAVMSTYGGSADTLTYTVGNGRPESVDGSSAIGLFVNSLALRVRTAGGTWRELMAAGLESERASMPYRRLPMAELKRHQGSEPLAETLFFFTNYHVFGVLDRWIDRGVSHIATELYGESTFPFCAIFRLNRENGRLEVRLEYDSLQFSAELMDGVRDCYAAALVALATDPDARYDIRSLAPARDRERLREVCGAPAATDDRRCLHELIEEQVARRPDATALQIGDDVVSYREMDRRANRLAHLLRARGAGPERVVGVLAERSIAQIVSLLAVLKAGGAYLPLDPTHPDDHVAALLADARCDLVIAQDTLAARVPAGPAVVTVDWNLRVADGFPTCSPRRVVADQNPAYVIYTSGSTGQPKGVVVEHRSAVRSTLARHNTYPLPVDRYLLLSSFAFDSSVAGIFWTLGQGGTLVLPPDGTQREPAALIRLIATSRPSHMLGIPSLLKLLLDQCGAGDLRSLRLVISAGEACPADLARGYASRLPGCTFANEYGPTEATVWATGWSVASGSDGTVDALQVPIGRPIPGVRVIPLNHRGQWVPVGVSGELHIGGAGVARGYLGLAGDTAARFTPDPHADRPGARRYVTGDLGRVLPSGDLEFQGRVDHQVKIQGFRVELGAIEALLDGHPSVHRSIVVAHGDSRAERALLAYLLPASGQNINPGEIREYVRSRLPSYLVPAAVVVIESVPLTPTGKVDRASLPPVSYAQLARVTEYVAPRTDVERTLAAIWCHALNLDRVGVTERFFDIGGESLRAMQVIAATNKIFSTALSVRRLFDGPTIADLAADVDATRAAGNAG